MTDVDTGTIQSHLNSAASLLLLSIHMYMCMCTVPAANVEQHDHWIDHILS